jgi:hypothetical protein
VAMLTPARSDTSLSVGRLSAGFLGMRPLLAVIGKLYTSVPKKSKGLADCSTSRQELTWN